MNEFTKYLPYKLTLQAPAIITTLSAEPNSARTLAYVPGNAVRGALAARLLASGLTAQSDDFQNLILGGRVRYLHAYPATDSTRALPTPIPWRREKGREPAPAFDLAAFTGHVDADTSWHDADGELVVSPEDVWPTKPLDRKGVAAFIAFAGSSRLGMQSRTDARVHQQRDRERGRSWKSQTSEISHGAIFTYEFLEAGQEFHGLIQVFGDSESEGEEIIAKITSALERQCVLLGRSRRAGYGGDATIEFGRHMRWETKWDDVQQVDVPAGRMFRLYLLSACIVRDPLTGQIDPCALPEIVQQHLGGRESVRVERTLWDFETIGGFNRTWQLEVPQALAVKAGSVLVLKAQQTISASRLRELAHAGLGERRIEGFGRFVFLEHRDSQTVDLKKPSDGQAPIAKPSGKEPPELITFLQQRILDAAVNRSIDRKASEIVGRCKNPPTGSLLGRLRIPLRNGSSETALETLRQWLPEPALHPGPKDCAALKKEAQDKIAACQLQNSSLRDWLIRNANAAAGFELAREVFAKQHINDSDFSSKVAEKRGAYYAVRQIDAVLATLARMARKERRSKS